MKRINKKNKNKSANKKKINKKREIRKKLKSKTKKNKINENKLIKVENANKSDDNYSLKALIRTIFNLKEAKRQLSFLGIDFKSLPPIIKDQFFKSCCDILVQIEKIIYSKEINHRSKKDKFFNLSKEYYKLVPHIFPFPDYNLYLINDIDKIQREICLLELIKSYYELEQQFFKIKNNKDENDLNNSNLNDSINLSVNNLENPIEEERHISISNQFFEKAISEFDYSINVVDKFSDEYEDIREFLDLYTTNKDGPFPPLNLLELFRLDKENDNFKEVNLFWYGCEIPHFYSILKNGLRLPFKEAPKNAFIYGKGILFSDNPYRQIQKCLPKNNIAFLFICSTGKLTPKFVHLHHKNYPEQLKEKYNSISIRYKIKLTLEDSDEKSKTKKPYTHYYDFIIYDLSLVKLKYIAKIEIP